jgi:WD40 repeat protein
MDTEQVIARFEAERQALAILDHPNIARVLDAGCTSTGRPYFVMELVRGIKITEYCDQHRLTTDQRLHLFMQVCQAIQHAHQKGIIHRDVKPSNILVTHHDGVPVPKVIDFGIAKATEQRLTEKTLFTEFHSFMGTPAYMSPEQAEMSGLDIDTRTDIYSLGVLLYELLTGRTPFDPDKLFESGLEGCRRTIREVDPIPPSTRIATLEFEDKTTTANRQQTEALRLVHRLSGDLDWIVMKCLEKDRTRRYDAANDIARDLQRYLSDEPILARPPSTWYRLGKFVHRNRVLVGASAFSSLILLTAVIVSSWMAFQATRAKEQQTILRRAAELAEQSEARQRAIAEEERLVALRRAYISDMNLVQQALTANNHGRMLDLLERQHPKPGRPDFRQWEWRYFWDQTRSDALFQITSQSNTVVNLQAAPTGRLLLTSDRHGNIQLWDSTRPSLVSQVTQREAGVEPLGFSPDGNRVLLGWNGRGGGRLKLWDVASRRVAMEWELPGSYLSAAFHLDGQRILSLGEDLILRTWDTTSGMLMEEIPLTESDESSPAESEIEGWMRWSQWLNPGGTVFSPDLKWLALEDHAGIRIMDSSTGQERIRLQSQTNGVASMAFSPDGQRFAISPSFNNPSTALFIYDIETGGQLFQLDAHTSWIPKVIFSADGSRLISAGADQTIRLWDAHKGTPISVLRGHRSEVHSIALAQDGARLISGGRDGSVLCWNLDDPPNRRTYLELPVQVQQIVFFPTSNEMLSVGFDGRVRLWSMDRMDQLDKSEPIDGFGSSITRLVIAPDGSRVYASTRRGEILAMDWATRLLIKRWQPSRTGVYPLGLIENGSNLVLATWMPHRNLEVWNTQTWEKVSHWDTDLDDDPRLGPPPITSTKSQPHAEQQLRPDPPPKGAQTGGSSRGPGARGPGPRFGIGPGPSSGFRSFPGRRPPNLGEWVLGYAPSIVLVQDWDGAVEFVDIYTGIVQETLPGAGWGLWRLTLSADGEWLASASNDGTINLYNNTTREWSEPLRGHLLGVHSVAFSPDGQRLASGSTGKEAVKLWDIKTQQEVATLVGEGPLFGSIQFSPNGEWLVAINSLGKALLWHAPSEPNGK